VNRKPRQWQIPVGLLALALAGALVWWMLENRLTEQTRARWQQTLHTAGLADAVQWQDFRASPWGTVTVNQLRVALPSKIVLSAGEVRISEVIDQPERQRIRVQLTQAKPDVSEMPITGYVDYGLVTTVATVFHPNPMNVSLLVDVDFARDQAKIVYDSQQEGFADLALQLDLSRIAALRGVVKQILPSMAAAAAGRNAKAMTDAIDPELLATAPAISLDALEASMTNRGMVAQMTAGLKLVILADLLRAGQPFTMREGEAAFANKVATMQADCHRGVATLKPICQRIADVALDKEQSLHLTAKPSAPVSLAQVLAQLAATKGVLSVLELLNVNVK